MFFFFCLLRIIFFLLLLQKKGKLERAEMWSLKLDRTCSRRIRDERAEETPSASLCRIGKALARDERTRMRSARDEKGRKRREGMST